jgi:serine/threonine protein kinase
VDECKPLVDGGELYDLLQSERRFSPDTAAFYAGSLLLALDAIHARGIAYRDLKPENIMLNTRGHIRIVDFGFARYVGGRGLHSSTFQLKLSRF